MTEILKVTPEGEFIWHEDADRLIEESDFTNSPSMPHILRALRRAQPEQEPVAWMYPDALCDKACLYQCTKAFTQFPECAINPTQRKPLTDEQRKNMGDKYGGKLHRPDSAAYWYFKGIDDTEAAHGIKETS